MKKKHLKRECRRGFKNFFENAGLNVSSIKIIACGDRHRTYHDFCKALKLSERNETPLLLVDSEQPVSHGNQRENAFLPWNHLLAHDGWFKPKASSDNQAHMMVQCMESWFLADIRALKDFFGERFSRNSLPGGNDLENVETNHVISTLKNASRRTQKGKYSKSSHSFEILRKIDPENVFRRSRWARRLKDLLQNMLR